MDWESCVWVLNDRKHFSISTDLIRNKLMQARWCNQKTFNSSFSFTNIHKSMNILDGQKSDAITLENQKTTTTTKHH